MKYILEYKKHKTLGLFGYFGRELQKYVEYFKIIWNMEERNIAHKVKEKDFDGKVIAYLDRMIGNSAGNTGSQNDYLRAFIEVNMEGIRVHVYSYERIYNTRTSKVAMLYNVLTECENLHRHKGNLNLMDLFRSSEASTYKPKLVVCDDAFGLSNPKTGENGPNVLDNIFDKELFEKDILTEFSVAWFYLLPHYIHFGKEEVIRDWWETLPKEENIHKITNAIKESGEWTKFISIVGNIDALDASNKMGGMGF